MCPQLHKYSFIIQILQLKNGHRAKTIWEVLRTNVGSRIQDGVLRGSDTNTSTTHYNGDQLIAQGPACGDMVYTGIGESGGQHLRKQRNVCEIHTHSLQL